MKKAKLFQVIPYTFQGQILMAKVFPKEIISKYELEQTLDYNVEVLGEQYSSFIYPEYFNQIVGRNDSDANTQTLFTKNYVYRLDDYIAKKGPRSQNEALSIFEDIFKSVYSLIMDQFYHYSLKAQHFVFQEGKWKMDILIDQQENTSGQSYPYLFDPQYQPPQAYKRDEFTLEQIDQRIVWNLGCILIHILSGSHKLKNQAVLDKFIDQPFNFDRIGVNINNKLSSQLKLILGKMCHHKQQKRMSFKQLILNGFILKQIGQNHEKNKSRVKNKNKNSSSVKPMDITKIQKELNVSISKLKNIHQQNETLINDESNDENQDKTFEKSSRFHEKIRSLILDFTSTQFKNISSQPIKEIIDLYKNFLDQGEILRIGVKRFKQMISELSTFGNELIQLTIFALNFVKTMNLSIVTKSLNQNRIFFAQSINNWQIFHDSKQYHILKKIINKRNSTSKKQLQILRSRLLSSKNKFLSKDIFKDFVQNKNPQTCSFADIKGSYRRIVKFSYDLVASQYFKNKDQQWGRLAMYITYCLCIDKLTIEDKFKSNFKHFFEWKKIQPCNYISLEEFQNYLENAPVSTLIQNSKYILQTYFQV